jgi:membrane protease YdiL (CAAX protease family)
VSRALVLGTHGRVGLLAALVMLVEYARALAGHQPGLELVALLGGGLGLGLVALGRSPRELGLGSDRLPGRLLGGLALAVALLLPAAARWHGGPPLAPQWSLAAVAVSVGEELAFRGALFAAIEEVGGGVAAVLGTTILWTVAHALTHPPEFLVPVAAAGLLLGIWRLVTRDLVGPIVGHVLADLAL